MIKRIEHYRSTILAALGVGVMFATLAATGLVLTAPLARASGCSVTGNLCDIHSKCTDDPTNCSCDANNICGNVQ
jgi:hypothetical protein